MLNTTRFNDVTTTTMMPNLRELRLHACSELTELLSISKLQRLQILDVSYCHKLQRIPETLPESLVEFIFQGCYRLTQLPIRMPGKLQVFCGTVTNNTLPIMPSSIEKLSLIRSSNIMQTDVFRKLAHTNLRFLNVSMCFTMYRIPAEIASFSMLEHLDVSFCSWLSTLPTELCALKQTLRVLDVSMCSELELHAEYFEPFQALRELVAYSVLRDAKFLKAVMPNCEVFV